MELKKSDFFTQAILEINPSAQVSVMGEAKYSNITWLDDTTPIAEQDILDKQDELWSAYQTKEYQRKRLEEYPSLQDCIHAILDDDLENLQALRQAVKTKYPKENS